MQYTAYNIANLWKEGYQNFSLYELTKGNKVIKHPIRELLEFDECVVIAIGDDKKQPKQRLMFSNGNSTKKSIGDSVYYTDINLIRSRLIIPKLKKELEEEIADKEFEIEALRKFLESRKKKLERLNEGFSAPYLIELEKEDREEKEKITFKLQKTIYHKADRYGSDLSFSFLIDRLFEHSQMVSKRSETKGDYAKLFTESTNEELQDLLNKAIIDYKNIHL